MSETVLVLGSGPIRIGQGIEFDYSCVHCVWALEEMGYRAIIINNNPETVSTDFDTGDGLYFEPVTLPDVLGVVRHENPIGVVCQFGGQTAINLAAPLKQAGVPVLGTSPEAIAMAEDRGQFDDLLESLGIARPRGKATTSLEDAVEVATAIGYPVLVRPSFVLGGRAMEIVHDEDHLRAFYGQAEEANPGQPVLIDKYLFGTEAEVDVISDGESTLVPGIMEHIERAGVHSGDSMAVYPPVSLTDEVQANLVLIACRIARALNVKGLMNIQFVIAQDADGRAIPYVLEVNPRASRTVPYISKVTGIPMVDLATRCMMGQKLTDLGFESGLWVLDPAADMPSQGVKVHAKGRIIAEREFEQNSAAIPDPILYPYADQTLSLALKKETELFFDSLVREDRSLLELLTADYTFVNERVARHYGIPNVTGPAFRRVTVPEERRGILGHGSVLTLTSIADRTSPVMRGKWVMEVLLGSPPPPPPPNVPALEETKGTADTGRVLSVRERMEQHRSNPACTSCHKVIDPLGLALEPFDATGKWRVKDGGAAVDPSGVLYDGTTINGPAGLRAALLRHQDAVLLSFTRSLMTYALGRRVEPADMPAVRKIIRAAEAQDYKMSAFINGVIRSSAFQMARMPATDTSTTTAAQGRQD